MFMISFLLGQSPNAQQIVQQSDYTNFTATNRVQLTNTAKQNKKKA